MTTRALLTLPLPPENVCAACGGEPRSEVHARCERRTRQDRRMLGLLVWFMFAVFVATLIVAALAPEALR